jgi:hypothetical protein
MKKVFYLLIIIGLFLFQSHSSSGQARLHIVQIDSFPVFPGDTAYEGQVYHNIRIVVKNVGTNNFFGDIHVFLYSQSLGVSALDTLRDDPFHPNYLLGPGDSVSLPANPLYTFRSIHYAAGDNIVVVWPYSGATNFDTYLTRIYLSLVLGIREPEEAGISIYPNPVSEILRLNYLDENKVEEVRIYDLVGREIFNVNKAIEQIDLKGFDPGIYFVELSLKDGRRLSKKILVTAN